MRAQAAAVVLLLAGAVANAVPNAVVSAAASGVASASPAKPRVVSINPCVDAILIRVADFGQIAAISHYSQDPTATSIPLEVASRFKVTSGTAEEVVALQPDIVLTGPHVAPSTIFALERIGVKLIKQTVAESVEQSERQIEQIGVLVGAPERGRALAAEIEQAVQAARPADARKIGAVIWQGGGLVPGAGTLADELLTRTGYRNMSATYGLAKWGMLPIEYLLASPPELVLSVGTGEGGRDRMLGHPAVRALAKRIAFRPYSFKLLQCGGPTIIEAVTYLAAIHRELVAPATPAAARTSRSDERSVAANEFKFVAGRRASLRKASFAALAASAANFARVAVPAGKRAISREAVPAMPPESSVADPQRPEQGGSP